MKKNKIIKGLAVLLTASAVVSMTGCGKKKTETKPDDNQQQTGGNTDSGNTSGGNTDSGDTENLDNEIATAAKNALTIDNEVASDSITLPTNGNGGVAISWAADKADVIAIDGATGAVTRPGVDQDDVTVTLTATLVLNDVTLTKTFTITVKAVEDQSVTIAEAKAKDVNTKLDVRGIVTGFVYANTDVTIPAGFYLTDATDTVYVYGSSTAANVAVGDEVYFTATVDNYYGSIQLKLPENVAKLGEGKTATFNNVVTDKTVAEVVATPKGENNTPTAQCKVYELTVKFTKIATDTYVNYRVADPLDESKYMNIYYKSTIVPGTTYAWTEQFDSYDGKYCKVLFYVYDSSSSGAWRGHILKFIDLAEEENTALTAKAGCAAEVNAIANRIESLYEDDAELALTVAEGYTLTVTPQEDAAKIAWNAEEGKLTITPTAEETTETVKFTVTKGDATFEKTVEIKTKKFVPTVGEGYTASAAYTTNATVNMDPTLNNASKIGLRPILFNVKTESTGTQVGLNKAGEIRLYNGTKLTVESADLGDLKLVITKAKITYKSSGSTDPTFKVNGVAQTFEAAEKEYTIENGKLVIENTASAQLWITKIDFEFSLVEKTDLDRATAEAERLAAKLEASYDEDTTVDLTPTEGYTVVVTPQEESRTLAFTDNTLSISITNEVLTETFTIAVTYNGETYTTSAISVETIGVMPTIESVITSAVGAHVTKGTVVAVTAKSFVVKDDTGMILVYKNAAPGVEIGDVVTLSGTTEKRNDLIQFTSSTVVTKAENKETVTQPTPEELDAAKMTALLSDTAPAIKYVTMTGTLVKSSSNYNINVFDTTAVGSISYPVDADGATALNGKKVKITGYFIGISSSKYVNVAITDIEELEFTETDMAKTALSEQANLFSAEYIADTQVTLPTAGTKFTDVTLTYTVTAGDTAATIADGKLNLTQKAEDVTVSVKITATKGETTEEITKTFIVKAKEAISPVTGAKATAAYTNTQTSTNMSNAAENNNAVLVGLNPELFYLTTAKNGASNEVGLNRAGDIRLYANTTAGNGTALTISCVNPTGLNVKIDSIKINWGSTIAAVKVGGNAVADVVANGSSTIEVNASSVTIQNVNTTNVQAWIKSIEITYTITAVTE